MKHLIKSNNQIYSLNEYNRLINPPVSNPPTKEDFELYGLEDLSVLVAPTDRVIYVMQCDGVEGDGRVFSKKITSTEWQRMVQKTRVK